MLVTTGNNLAGLNNNNNKKYQLTYISCCYGLNHCPFIPAPQILMLKPLTSSVIVFEVRPLGEN